MTLILSETLAPPTMATKGRNSFYDKANAIEAPALGASLQLDSPEDRDLLKNLYSALGRSGTAPLLPKHLMLVWDRKMAMVS